MISEPCELWIRTGSGKDPGVAFGAGAPTLPLKSTGDDYRPAARGARVDDLVNEVDKLVWKPNSDLLAHPKMVAKWYGPQIAGFPVRNYERGRFDRR